MSSNKLKKLYVLGLEIKDFKDHIKKLGYVICNKCDLFRKEDNSCDFIVRLGDLDLCESKE